MPNMIAYSNASTGRKSRFGHLMVSLKVSPELIVMTHPRNISQNRQAPIGGATASVSSWSRNDVMFSFSLSSMSLTVRQCREKRSDDVCELHAPESGSNFSRGHSLQRRLTTSELRNPVHDVTDPLPEAIIDINRGRRSRRAIEARSHLPGFRVVDEAPSHVVVGIFKL